MTIEATLISIDSKLGEILAQLAKAPVAAATPVVMEPKVNITAGETAVAAAGLTQQQAEPLPTATKRGARKAKETAPVAQEPVVETTAPVVSSAEDFLSLGEPEVQTKEIKLTDVRAALAIVQAKQGQPVALKIFRDASGVETLAKLTRDKYAAVYNAALPTGTISFEDVRAVLVAANGRKANSGLEILKKHGCDSLKSLTEESFVQVILDAQGVQ